jgi:hypothetical protein
MTAILSRLAGALAVGICAGCAASHATLIGRPRPPIAPDSVQIYLQPPGTHYEQIANLTASSRGSLAITEHGKIDTVIERLKKAAARVGANGILLYGVGDEAGAMLGAGIGTDSGHSPYVQSIGSAAILSRETGAGIAIYVGPAEPLPGTVH